MKLFKKRQALKANDNRLSPYEKNSSCNHCISLWIRGFWCKTRKSGNQISAELHLSIDCSLSVKEVHDLTDHLK
jgi:hypothetical protein